MNGTSFGCLGLLLISSPLIAEERMLFQFAQPQSATQWQTVNDGVMGGRSEGYFKIDSERHLKFYGTLSLENNGGFASVRSRPTTIDLQSGDSIVARLCGDGRQYSINLYVPTERAAFSYRAFFDTTPDEWIEVNIPLTKFQATSFGQAVNQPLDPGKVNAMGFLLGDKQAGPFQLEVDWIKVVR